MKKLFILLAFVATSVTAKEPVIAKFKAMCWPLKEFAEEVSKFNEDVVLVGRKDTDKEPPSMYSILYNKEKDTFTIVQFDQTVGCILGVGVNLKFKLEGLKKEDL